MQFRHPRDGEGERLVSKRQDGAEVRAVDPFVERGVGKPLIVCASEARCRARVHEGVESVAGVPALARPAEQVDPASASSRFARARSVGGIATERE
jgi:hypothetical protein